MDYKKGHYKVADLSLAAEGRRLIDWAESRMPVLMALREKYRKELKHLAATWLTETAIRGLPEPDSC